MVKKISFLIISVTILVTAIIGFNKLAYWNRSSWIFKLNSNTQFEGRGRIGRGPGQEGFRRGEIRELPDSIRARFERGESRPGQGFRDRMGRGPFEGGMGRGEGRGRRELPGGKKISLRNVQWFLAIFAGFTVIIIYLDKAISHLRRKKAQ